NHVIPTAIQYQNRLVENIRGLKEIGVKSECFTTTMTLIEDIAKYIAAIQKNVEDMVEARKRANKVEDTRTRALLYYQEVLKYFSPIRYAVDKLELIVDNNDWPLVKYREMLFLR